MIDPRLYKYGISVVSTLLSLCLSIQAQAQDAVPAAEIWGQWATQGYGGVVDIYPCQTETEATQLCGDLVWVWDPADVDLAAIQQRMLWGFEFKDEAWRGGRLQNPEDGKTYKGKITLRDADLLDLKGCAGPFCKTQTWRRLQSLPHVNLTHPDHRSKP